MGVPPAQQDRKHGCVGPARVSRQSEEKRELKLEPRGPWRSSLQRNVLRQPLEGELQKGAVSDLNEVERKGEDSEVCTGNGEGTPVVLGRGAARCPRREGEVTGSSWRQVHSHLAGE